MSLTSQAAKTVKLLAKKVLVEPLLILDLLIHRC